MVTKDEFLRYRKVQKSGRFNMFKEGQLARVAADLSRDTYLEIIARYDELARVFMPEESDG